MKRSSSHLIAATLTLLLCTLGQAGAVQFTKPAQIERNPNDRAPLAAVLSFETDQAVTTRVDIDDGRKRWTLDFPLSASGKVRLPIVGMRAATLHRFKLTVADAKGAKLSAGKPLTYLTPALPSDPLEFPVLRVNRAEVALMEPGVTLMTVRRSALSRSQRMTRAQKDFSEKWGLIVAVDTTGEVVWYYRYDSRIAGVATLRNGNIFFHTAQNSPVEIDLLGNTVRKWGAAQGPHPMPKDAIPVQAVTLHHQPEELPNGNFLSLSAFPKVIENYYSSETDANAPRKTQTVMGDELIEFTPQGEVVWRWNAFDYLDPFKIGYETFSPYWWVRGFPQALGWSHGNGVHYDRHDDSILVSFRKLDAIVKIDRKSKDIKWILARDVGWSPALRKKLLAPVGDNFQYFSHQHNPRVTPDGNVVVFNNNVYQAIPFTGEKVKSAAESLSNAIVYKIDAERMTAQVVFATPTEPEGGCHVWAEGDAHVLPKTGNVLVDFAMCTPGLKVETFNELDLSRIHPMELPWTPRIREYRQAAPDLPVFDLQVLPPQDLIKWDVFGIYRVPSLYATH